MTMRRRPEGNVTDMGTFRTTIMIESAERRGEMRTVEAALVDTGLEGLNVRVDAQRKQLVPAGPILAGAA